MSVEASTNRAPARAQVPSAAHARAAGARPHLGPVEFLLQLWRAKWLMLLVFAPVVLAGLVIAHLAPTTYTASARLLVRMGPEYVYDPILGDAGKGAFLQPEGVMQTEAELAASPVIAERVINAIGLSNLYPALDGAKLRARQGNGDVIGPDALKAFAQDLKVYSAPHSSILRMTFSHGNPDLAATTLNHVVSEYLAYRQEVLAGGGAHDVGAQRQVIEKHLAVADRALQDYLAVHDLNDFEAEYAAVTTRVNDISAESASIHASIREVEARSAALARQIAASRAQRGGEAGMEQAAAGLRLNRSSPDPAPAPQGVASVAQLRTDPAAELHVIEADHAAGIAVISGLKGRAAALAGQQIEAERRLAQLTGIQADYQRLKRDRDALESAAAAYAAREQVGLARNEFAAASPGNVSVYETSRPSGTGDSAGSMIALAAAALGLVAALVAGIFRARSAVGFATTGSLARTTGLPVLAAVRER